MENIHYNHLPKEIEKELEKMSLGENNTTGKFAELRDSYLEAEKNYVMSLLQLTNIKELISNYNIQNSEDILRLIEQIIFKLENNLISEDERQENELLLIILLCSIKDKVLKRTEPVLTSEFSWTLSANGFVPKDEDLGQKIR